MMEYILFGESHGPAVGVLLRNVPAGLPVDEELICADLLRRKASGGLTTSRTESDAVEFLSGVYQGKTTGDPVAAILRNENAHGADYDALKHLPRPGHADYAAFVRSGGHNDPRGGGHCSGRLTAPLVAAGALAKTYLEAKGITVHAEIVDEEALRRRAAAARSEGDSVGGQVRCIIRGVPPGLGGRDYAQAVESEIARHVFAVPAVKAIGFGAGEEFAAMWGSDANDALRTDGERVYTLTNHAGGINGGITNGMDIAFTVTFRPTPSIAKVQQTVDLSVMENAAICVNGRHDACVVLRAAPAVEAAAALALCTLWQEDADDLPSLRRELDGIDEALVALFARRQELSLRIGAYKKSHALPVRDESREAEILDSRAAMAPEHADEVKALYGEILRLSREVQE